MAHPNDKNNALPGEVDDAPYTFGSAVTPAAAGTEYTDGPARALWVGGTGNVDVETWPDKDRILFTAVPDGTLLKVATFNCVSTTTTASSIVALY